MQKITNLFRSLFTGFLPKEQPSTHLTLTVAQLTEGAYPTRVIGDYFNFNTYQSEVAAFKKGLSDTRLTGRQDGMRNIPSPDTQKLTDTERQISVTLRDLYRRADAQITLGLGTLCQNLLRIQQDIENFCEDQRTKYYRKRARNVLSQKLNAYSIEKTQREEELGLLQGRLSHLANETYNRRPPTRKAIWDREFGYALLLLAVCAVEFPLNESAARLVITGINAKATLLAAGLSALLALSAHVVGHNTPPNSKQARTYRNGSVAVAVVTFSLIAYLRLSAQISDLSVLIFGVLSYLCGIYFAQRRAQHAEYWKLHRRVAQLRREIDDITAEQKRTEDDIALLAEDAVAWEARALQTALDNHSDVLRRLKFSRGAVREEIENLWQQGITAYRNANGDQRASHAFEPVGWWAQPIPPLFQDTDPPAPKNGTDTHFFRRPESGQSKADDRNNGTPATEQNARRRIGFHRIALVVLGCLLLPMMSCQKTAVVRTEIVVVRDVTCATDLGNLKTYLPTDLLGLDGTTLTCNGAMVRLQVLDAHSSNRNYEIPLDTAPTNFWLRDDAARMDSIASFGRHWNSKFDRFAAITGHDKKTQLNRLVTKALNELSRSNADKKILYVFSDLFENGTAVSFYRYKDNPRGLLADFDQLAAALREDILLLNLDGVEINIVHQPTIENDEFHEFAKRFFTRYWSEHGAVVNARSTL